MEKNLDINNLTAEELLKELYGKELTSKKTVLEYIEMLKVIKQDGIEKEKIQENYNFVWDCIDKMAANMKPNTMLHLKNQLKALLGKLVKDKDPKKDNNFVKFFKRAYPANERKKDFTWVLMDINNISEEQIWTTLTYINRQCLRGTVRLFKEEKKDILEMVEKLVAKNNMKYINQIKSLEKLVKVLNIEIVNRGNFFVVECGDREDFAFDIEG